MPPRADLESYTVEELIQRVIDKDIQENVTMDAEQPHRFYIDNLIKRVFAHLFALADTGPKRLKCTEAGYLKVSTYGSAIEKDYRYSYSSISSEQTQVFPTVVQGVFVDCTSGNCKIKFSHDGITYGNDYYISQYGNGYFQRAVKSYKINYNGQYFSGYVYGEY